MWLRHLTLRNYRNFEKVHLEFDQGAQLLTGANGAGKTNILEALCLILSSHSFRTHRLSECVRFGSESAHVQVGIMCRGIEHQLELHLQPGSRRLLLNKKLCRDWAGLFPCVSWVPEDLELVRAGPSIRRLFLDHHLIQTDPLYSHHLARYYRALEQRNSLLKLGHTKGLEAFETQMANSASYMMGIRKAALQDMHTQFQQLVCQLGFEGLHSLNYDPCSIDHSVHSLCQMWSKHREQEIKARQTLKGPHLEDFQVLFNLNEARRFASEGQARVCVAALKIAEWKRLASHEQSALLLIDEIGMGLDKDRWQSVWQLLQGWQQVFLTSPHHLDGFQADLWRVDQGSCWRL